ncbi:protein ENHANCED DISEASE RESISTANCE 2 isoform X2 [Cryptomeria japonica]|uniref:protein ENHANCED DISEASE RESISTANCE 2 isoform X2 n=1 Tax=Cryptomeria japonica TaxID=3369 RepID=UPI0027DA14E9|nr:protein ENHANCED DISEASE RESISTANCE 2 isoform X2 [Cryptomeria japonica]
MNGREVSDNDNSDSGSGELERAHYGGWIYHLGTNSFGHQFCHLRYLLIKGKYVEMYKRSPGNHQGQQPIRRGVASQYMMLEDMGLRKVNHGDFYVLRIYSRLDDSKKGEAAFDLGKSSTRKILNNEDEFTLDGHRPRIRRYAHGVRKLITIGKGPETLLRQSSDLDRASNKKMYLDENKGDAVDPHKWKCIHTVNGIRIFEDVADDKGDKLLLMKSVGVVDASPDAVFEMVISLDKSKRYEWDMLTSDLELVERLDGHNDIVYGTYDPKYLSKWHSKRDFLFSRQWLREQDGTYIILQNSTTHKKFPQKSGISRMKLNSTVWEITNASARQNKGGLKSVVSQTMELSSTGWGHWRKRYYAKFEKTIPYVLLCQVAGLREYFGANPGLSLEALPVTAKKKAQGDSDIKVELPEFETEEEFYDAIAAQGPMEGEDSDEDEDEQSPEKAGVHKLKNISWAVLGMSLMGPPGRESNTELMLSVPAIEVDVNQFRGSLKPGKDGTHSNCWAEPGGSSFMVRSKTYLKDYSKVPGGDPLLKLLAVDWFKSEDKIDKVAMHPRCVVQGEACKKLPFILVINLQVPAKPNYSMVFYFGANRPIRKGSLLDKFANGSDMFRDEHFKLIPSIAEGYWMVKRAVGTKACLLGRAVTCNYLRQDNFLEIDVDIGSSSVARGIIGLVLGYVTSIVIDLAILIEGKEEHELPEYLLGTVRLNRVRPDSAITFWGHA